MSLQGADKVEWSRKYAPREEIQEYYVEMAKYYGLGQSTTFNTSVISATWDEDAMLWRVLTENVKTGETKIWTARVVRFKI
jgi:cation diffusion facilitator CzcD-associated flavoprotein CzcO